MKNIDLDTVKQQPEEFFSMAAQESEVMITENGQPIFKLIRLHSPRKRRLRGSAKNLIVISPDFEQPLEDWQEYTA